MTPPTDSQSLAGSRRDSTALALLGAMLLVLAVIVGVSVTAAATGAIQDIVRSVKAAFGRDEVLVSEQHRQTAVIAALERRVHSVAAEVGGLASRAQMSRYQDAAVSDRFATLETDIAALTAEIRALRAARNVAPPAVVETRRDHTAHLELALAAAGNDILSLRSSFDALAQGQRQEISDLAEAHKRDIADLAHTHRTGMADLAQAQRKDIADVTARIDRIEQMVAARDLTGSIKTASRKKKARARRSARGHAAADIAPVHLQPGPLQPAPAFRR